MYRSERDVFDEYTEEERDKLFGRAPKTVWENIMAFEKYPEKLEIFKRDDVMTDTTLASYREAVISQWETELQGRIVPETMDVLRDCAKAHDEDDCVDYDRKSWSEISRLRDYLGRNTMDETCLLTRIVESLESKEYEQASDMLCEMQIEVEKLIGMYLSYKKNLY